MLPDIARPPASLAALTERFRPALWRYVRTLGADAATADDVVQEAFVIVLRRERFDASARRDVPVPSHHGAPRVAATAAGRVNERQLAEADEAMRKQLGERIELHVRHEVFTGRK